MSAVRWACATSLSSAATSPSSWEASSRLGLRTSIQYAATSASAGTTIRIVRSRDFTSASGNRFGRVLRLRGALLDRGRGRIRLTGGVLRAGRRRRRRRIRGLGSRGRDRDSVEGRDDLEAGDEVLRTAVVVAAGFPRVLGPARLGELGTLGLGHRGPGDAVD